MRPQEKLLQSGVETLSDAELLAVFLRTGLPGKPVLKLAQDLLERYGSLGGVLSLSVASFVSQPGLGHARYAQLQASMELMRRWLGEKASRTVAIEDPHSVRQFLSARLSHLDREVFAVVYLDSQHRVKEYEPLFFGTIDSASVHPREVVKRALHHNASALIVAHNHPSGVSEPSPSDRLVTERLSKALKLIDVTLLDHIVIGMGEMTSLAELGWL